MVKNISIKQIAKEIGKVDGNKVSPKLAYLIVVGAREVLVYRAFNKSDKVSEVTSPSEAQLRKLAVKLTTVRV